MVQLPLMDTEKHRHRQTHTHTHTHTDEHASVQPHWRVCTHIHTDVHTQRESPSEGSSSSV